MAHANYQLPSSNTHESERSDALNEIPANRCILLVEPDPVMLMTEALLLTRDSYCVRTACSHWQIFDFRHIRSLHVAVLSDALGASALSRSAHAIRKQWPLARILVVGRAASVLGDNLYEADTPHSADPMMLLAAIQELIRVVRSSMHADPESSDKVAGFALPLPNPTSQQLPDLAQFSERNPGEELSPAFSFPMHTFISAQHPRRSDA